MNKITSRDNPKLKHARRVRDGKAADEIFVEGVRLAEEALSSDTVINSVLISSNFGKNTRDAQLVRALENRGSALYEVDERLLRSIADTKNSQGVLLLCRRPDTSFSRFEQRDPKRARGLTIFLSRVNNPANLGAILRTAEAAGVSGVIVSRNSTDAFSPRSLRASMGSALRLSIWEDAAFDDVTGWAREHGLITTAADIGADLDYAALDWNRLRLLVFGSEAEGLSSSELAEIDEQIRIPMENGVESLNLAVSCGVILFEAKRQRSLIG
jgi:TrmH family RNA methyltransferase